MRHFGQLWMAYATVALLVLIAFLQWADTQEIRQQKEARMLEQLPFMHGPNGPGTSPRLSYANGLVTTERYMNFTAEEYPQGVVADWVVTVVRDNAQPPSCRTQAGNQINQGWSVYMAGERQPPPMPINMWVGDDDCWETLSSRGVYHMHVIWTPRDSTLAPARASMTFIPDKG